MDKKRSHWKSSKIVLWYIICDRKAVVLVINLFVENNIGE